MLFSSSVNLTNIFFVIGGSALTYQLGMSPCFIILQFHQLVVQAFFVILKQNVLPLSFSYHIGIFAYHYFVAAVIDAVYLVVFEQDRRFVSVVRRGALSLLGRRSLPPIGFLSSSLAALDTVREISVALRGSF